MPEPVGIETVGGMAEKALPIIQSPIFMRVTLPGVLALVVLHPFLPFLAALTTIQPSFPWKSLAFAVGVAFVVGALASTLNGEIYKLYEGRNLWPKPLYAFCTARQQRRVEKLLGRAEKARIANDKHRRAELWYRLRRYPVDEKGKRCATRPTLLGNILAEYEEYPKSRYGMDSMFYWPRIWMTLDKEKKQEIEASWSVADGFLGLSGVSFVGSILWLLAALLHNIAVFSSHLSFKPWVNPYAGGFLLLAFGYTFYRVSLPFHRANGDTFKAIFDLYRDRICAMTKVGPDESASWEGAWAYLQYLRVSCRGCGKHYPVGQDQCPHCGCTRAASLRELRREAESGERS